MGLDELAKGDKHELHLSLYERELDILDALCAKYDCSRSAAVGAILREYADTDLTGKVPVPSRPGTRSRRRGGS